MAQRFDQGLERRFEFWFDGPNGTRWLEAHVVPRPIEVDLTSDTSPLHRVPCAIVGANRACFAR